MASRSASFWTFIVILVLLHLIFRLALGVALVPDLITVALLLGARRLGGWQATLFGLVLGLLADALALTGFGATAVAYVVVGYLGSRSRNLFEGDSYLFVAFYSFIGAWLIEAIRYVAAGSGGRGVTLSYLVDPALLNSLHITIAAVVALIAYRAFSGHR
jgi:rod shape-determining protein MreD